MEDTAKIDGYFNIGLVTGVASIPIFCTATLREQCSADCSTLYGYHSVEDKSHVEGLQLHLAKIVTCDSIFTTQMV